MKLYVRRDVQTEEALEELVMSESEAWRRNRELQMEDADCRWFPEFTVREFGIPDGREAA